MIQLEPLVLLHFSTVEAVGRPDKIVTWPPTAGFKPYDKYFTKESVKHPAKANLHMIKWIIETYTKEGDWILDPMAGTGSTGVMALLLGRNTILVEYEQKFVDMINSNILQLIDMATINPTLQWTVIKGDARSLCSNCEHIIFSPPFGSDNANLKERTDKSAQAMKRDTGQVGVSLGKHNIGNLPYGSVDSIVTSPPYSGILGAGHRSKLGNIKEQGSAYQTFEEKADKNNIGNLDTKTYLSAMFQVYSECFKVLKPNGLMILVTKNFIRKKQVVRLDLDTIALCEKAGFVLKDRWYRKLTNFSFWVTNYYKKYGLRVEYEDILVFQKTQSQNGNINAIICSPPYSTTISSGDPEARKRRLVEAGYDPNSYMGGNARNLELKNYEGRF